MAKINNKADIAAKAYEKYKDFPNKSAIAEKIFADYPLVFKDKEDARFYVRYLTGVAGKQNSQHKRFDISHLPRSVAKKPKNFIVPSDRNNILVISDLHIPNHDQEAIAAALNYGKANDANCIVILGDLLDNTPFSSYDHPPSAVQVRKWFDMVNLFLFDIRMQFPQAMIVWAAGNHDMWYERWMIKKAPMIWDDPYYKLTKRLELDEKDIIWVGEKRKIIIDGLILLHGHTLVKGFIAPVNAARGVFLKAKASTMIGHVHSTSFHPERTLRDKLIGCYSLGCLCTLSPDYDPHNTKHNQGFAFIKRENSNYNVANLKFHEGKVFQ